MAWQKNSSKKDNGVLCAGVYTVHIRIPHNAQLQKNAVFLYQEV